MELDSNLKKTLSELKPEEKKELMNILSENKETADVKKEVEPEKKEIKEPEKTVEKEQGKEVETGEEKEDQASNKDNKKDVVNKEKQPDPDFNPKSFLNELQEWRKEFNEKFNQLADENYKLKDENTKLKNQKQRGFEPKPNPSKPMDEGVVQRSNAMKRNKW